MAWTITLDGNSNILITPGVGNANLNDLLESAIANSLTPNLIRAGSYNYLLNVDLIIEASPDVNSWLYWGGNIIQTGKRIFRQSNSRIRFSPFNTAGDIVGNSTILLTNATLDFSNALMAAPPNGSDPCFTEADGLSLLYRTGNAGGSGAVLGGYERNTISTYLNCNFCSDVAYGNVIFYLEKNASGAYINCSFVGWAAIEVSSEDVIKGIKLVKCGLVKNFSTKVYLEGWEYFNCDRHLQANNQPAYLLNCDVDLTKVTANSEVFIKNSVEFFGGAASAGGTLVVASSNKKYIYSKVFDSLGKVAGGNTKGISSEIINSERVAMITAVLDNTGIIEDYRSLETTAIAMNYGFIPQVFSLELKGMKGDAVAQIFNFEIDTYLELTSAQALNITGITINHISRLVTITGNITQSQLHDYCAAKKVSVDPSGIVEAGLYPIPECFFPTPGSLVYSRLTGVLAYALVIDGGTLTGTERITTAGSVTTTNGGSVSCPITDVNGTRTSLTISNLIPGSEVRLYDSNDQEVAGIELCLSSFIFQYTYTVPSTLRLVVFNVSYIPISQEVTLLISPQEIKVQQRFDRIFKND